MKKTKIYVSIILYILFIYTSIANGTKNCIKVTSLQNDIYQLCPCDTIKKIIILYNSYSCSQCHVQLNCFMQNVINEYPGYELIIIARVFSNDKYQRTFEYNTINKIYNNVSVYFDIHEEEESPYMMKFNDGIFKDYTSDKLPSLIILDSNITKIHYDSIFKNNRINISIEDIIDK